MSSSFRAQQQATERYLQLKFNDNPTVKQKKWIRYLFLLGVSWKQIRSIYNLRDATLLAIIKMPENWESSCREQQRSEAA